MIDTPRSYEPHAGFYTIARPKVELWRTVAGLGLIGAIYMALIVALLAIIRWHYGDLIAFGIFSAMSAGATPGALILLFLTFTATAVAVFAVARLLHGRRAGTLFGPPRRVISDFLSVARVVIALNLGLLVLALATAHSDDLSRHVPFGTFVIYLPFAVLGVFIQSAAEELVFRGYLQQQLAARFHMPLIWMGLPSALFAWLHYAPDVYGLNAVLIAVWAGIFGLLAADLTARTGNLGAAIGFHFANNLAAFLFIGIDGEMNGLALWTHRIDLTDSPTLWPLLAIDLLGMIVAWLLARLALRR
ncbi:MAG: CPBP family intramembrane glutamic endopeptidase [Albidovulum sp.]